MDVDTLFDERIYEMAGAREFYRYAEYMEGVDAIVARDLFRCLVRPAKRTGAIPERGAFHRTP